MTPITNGKRLDPPDQDWALPPSSKQPKLEEEDFWGQENVKAKNSELTLVEDWINLRDCFADDQLFKLIGNQAVFSIYEKAPHLFEGLSLTGDRTAVYHQVKARWQERIKEEFENREILKKVFYDDAHYDLNILDTNVGGYDSDDYSDSEEARQEQRDLFREWHPSLKTLCKAQLYCETTELIFTDLITRITVPGYYDEYRHGTSVYENGRNEFPLLKIIPAEISTLTELREIQIVNKQLREIPKWLGKLKNLERIILNDNQIREAPEELAQLENLKTLHLLGNPIERISKKIWELFVNKKLDLAVAIPPKSFLYENGPSSKNPWPWMPNVVLTYIFQYVSLTDLIKQVGLVCKHWYKVASADTFWRSFSINRLFPKSHLFDHQAWQALVPNLNTYNLVFEEQIPRITKRDYILLKRIESRTEDGKPLCFLTVPQNLTVADLITMLGVDAIEEKSFLRKGYPGTKDEEAIWKNPIVRIAALTDGVLKSSRFQERGAQTAYVKGLECQIPELLTVLAFRVLRNLWYKKNDPKTNYYAGDPNTRKTSTSCTHMETGKIFQALFYSTFEESDGIAIYDENGSERGNATNKRHAIAAQWNFPSN